jgi:hypothetical protein
VRAIVEACTDTPPGYAGGEKPDWNSRKIRHIQQVETARVAHRVSLADKVQSPRSILRDHTAVGERCGTGSGALGPERKAEVDALRMIALCLLLGYRAKRR